MTCYRSRSVISAGYAPLDVVLYDTHVRHSAGGTAGNVAAILSFLGWRSVLVSETGSDAAAAALRADLARAGVSTDYLRRGPSPTPRVVHRTSGSGPSYHFSCPACSFRFPRSRQLPVRYAEWLVDSAELPGVFFFDRANAGTVYLAERLASRGVRIAYEPASAMRTPYAMRAFRLAHILKFSSDPKTNRRTHLPVGRERQVQIVTSGRDGAFYRVGASSWRSSPAFEYPAIDEAGAGDWTTACFLHALPKDHPSARDVGDALTWAQAVAAVSCGSVGARGLAHVRSRDSVIRSARRLAESSPHATRSPRRRPTDEFGLLRASVQDACETCLEPATSASAGAVTVRWTTSAPTKRPTRAPMASFKPAALRTS